MEKTQFKEFFNKVLSGAAIGIVVGLIPGAIFGEIFKALSVYGDIFKTLHSIVIAIQFCVPVLVGMFTAMSFKLGGIHTASVAAASFVGSGVATFKDNVWTMKGTGDLINTILTAAIAVLIIRFYGDRLKNLTIVLIPIVGAVIPGFIGLATLPYVKKITLTIGNIISDFTNLQPLLMMVLIAMCFAVIIVTPLSTVAIAYAISLSGLGSGAANVGIAATVFTLAYASSKVNNNGTTIALFFAGPKILMANYLQNPIMTIPLAINAAVTGFFGYLFQIQGTTASAGFGITGLAGPINAYSFMDSTPLVKIGILIIQYLVVPLGIAVITHTVFTKMKLYSNNIYKFNTVEK